ncbi:hypothetical protein CANARDRAFT_27566 [[Candida] arabinofermentans NRRL YB-2248]|uniref:Uncharacterized protein n=1 Tax=[Candida] arabinofermentans NRRL YB-2248 TaxID=983967 RepID=A0A1E4T3M0_9ASCO|nr:hypothetical protein CANARDRAFT_27566 [[Candida] arabinofermentans NRRL YB-2248]
MSTTRERDIRLMNHQLADLQRNLQELQAHATKTAEQYEVIKKLGKSQASLFMSAHAVFQLITEKKEAYRQAMIKAQADEDEHLAADDEHEDAGHEVHRSLNDGEDI